MQTPLHVYNVTIKNERGETLEVVPNGARFRNYADGLEAARHAGHDPVDVWDEQGDLVVIVAGGRARPHGRPAA